MQVEELIKELGIVPKIGFSNEIAASCPFHSPDKHPSWYVNTKSGLHHCFSCGARGNLAHLVCHIRNVNYAEAVIYLNEKIGWAKANKWRENYENKNLAPQVFKVSEADLALFSDVPEEVLAGRNINPQVAKLFGVRWNPSNLSWILPIRDPYSNELWGWQEKFTNVRLFRNYPAGIAKSKTLFGLDAFSDGSTAIITESGLDSMRVNDFGTGSGLACSGVPLSDFQLSLIHERAESVIFALDNDTAGIRETKRVARILEGKIRIWIFSYDDSVNRKDPGEMSDEEIMLGFANMKSGLWWVNNAEKLKDIHRY